MRDIALSLVAFWALMQVFSKPYIGVYLWNWFSLMNPHRLTYGFAYSLPWAVMIAGVTLISLLTGKQKKLNVWSPESVVLLIFILWFCVTTLFAANPSGAFTELDRFLKIQLFIFITLALISDREKLNGFIWVIVLSIGYYGVKGGIFTLATGGSARVWGPPGSFIEGNNEIALAMLMTIPLMRYLQLQSTTKIIRLGLVAAMLLTAASILGSQSRGAFLGIMAIGFFFWWKSPHKVGATVMVAVVAAIILMFMPDTWWDRMHTIKTYDEDASAQGRINAWWTAFNTANARITGGGANMFVWHMFARYAPDPSNVRDVHSIYFEVLGEQGWIGLFLFLTLGVMAWRRCSMLADLGKRNTNLKWAHDLGLMLQVSLIAYATAGAFLGLAYYDYYYNLIAIILIAWRLSNAEAVAPAPASATQAPKAFGKAHFATSTNTLRSSAKPMFRE